jgi:(p)ppGpp synthase/HD superfamily hydrolase
MEEAQEEEEDKLTQPARMLSNAIQLTASLFRNTYDKNGAPYVLHCMEVMNGVKDRGFEVMAAAMMHDLVEDVPSISLEYLRHAKQFSPRIVELVDLMTKRENQTYDDYIERLSKDPDAVAIKMADLRHNSQIGRLPGFNKKDFERLEKYHKAYKKLQLLNNI